MGDLEERVLRLEFTVLLMQTQLEAINKNIFGLAQNIHVPKSNIPESNQSFPGAAFEELTEYSNEPSSSEGGQEEGQGVEEILGDIGEPLDQQQLAFEVPELDIKPQYYHHFNLKPCQVVLTRIPADQLLKYKAITAIPPQSSHEPPSSSDSIPSSSKRRRVVLNMENYSKARSYNPKNSDLPLFCGYCPKSIKYTSNSRLLAHLSSEHSNSSLIYTELYKCNYCQRCFKSAFKLKSHMESEEVPGVYSCTDCSLQFSSKFKTLCHWSRTHDQSIEFVCEYCSKVFYNSEDVTIHFRTKHPKAAVLKNENAYRKPRKLCPICGMFLLRKSLYNHIKRHREKEAKFKKDALRHNRTKKKDCPNYK